MCILSDVSLVFWFYFCHCVISARIRTYSGPHFSAFGHNTERYFISLRIYSGCGKIRTRITPNTDTLCLPVCNKYMFEKPDSKRIVATLPSYFWEIPKWGLIIELVKANVTPLKNSRVSAISCLNQRIIKNERDWGNFQILYPTIYSNKFFKLLKSYKFSWVKNSFQIISCFYPLK